MIIDKSNKVENCMTLRLRLEMKRAQARIEDTYNMCLLCLLAWEETRAQLECLTSLTNSENALTLDVVLFC